MSERMEGFAEYDAGHRYRYWLKRRWSDGPGVTFVMLNPSTAGAFNDDPTLRRCLGFARRDGFGTLCLVNLFAFMSTDPKLLLTAADPIGPENDRYIEDAAKASSVIVVAWGSQKFGQARQQAVLRIIRAVRSPDQIKCLGLTADGSPRHPLYVRGDATLQQFASAAKGLQ